MMYFNSLIPVMGHKFLSAKYLLHKVKKRKNLNFFQPRQYEYRTAATHIHQPTSEYQICYWRYSPKNYQKCQTCHIFVNFCIFLSGKVYGLNGFSFFSMDLNSTRNLQFSNIWYF